MNLRPLPRGLILGILRSAGIDIHDDGRDKIPLCCPIHKDTRPSAVVFPVSNTLHCSAGCGSFTAKTLAQRLGVPWPPPELRRARAAPPAEFSPADAQQVWAAALARARDDDAIRADKDVYGYLRGRGLAESFEAGLFGIQPFCDPVHPAVAGWAPRGYRLICPLHDFDGVLSNVQARRITPGHPKTLVPKRSKVGGRMFASASALEMLRGNSSGQPVIVLAEGLTDFLALATADPFPVLSASGAGCAHRCIGPWAAGRTILLAVDVDAAGQAVVQKCANAAGHFGAKHVIRLVWPHGAKDACIALEALRSTTALADYVMRRATDYRPAEGKSHVA